MQTEPDEQDRFLADLICTADEAADSDVARVSIGLEARVLSRIRESQAGEQLLERWATGFFRGALVSAAAVVALAAAAWFTTDLLAVEGNLAFSALSGRPSQLEFWPSTW